MIGITTTSDDWDNDDIRAAAASGISMCGADIDAGREASFQFTAEAVVRVSINTSSNLSKFPTGGSRCRSKSWTAAGCRHPGGKDELIRLL